MFQGKHIRIKNNLFLIEDDPVLSFRRSYFDGIEFPVHQLSEIIIAAFNTYSNYEDIVKFIQSKTFLPQPNIDTILIKWLELGLLEFYDKEADARYNRQIAFFDSLSPLEDYTHNIERQHQLKKKHILIIGIGGIGNYAALSFAAMGVGKITLVDGDKIEESNLNRQILFNHSSIGKFKSEVAAEYLKNVNPDCTVHNFPTRIDSLPDLKSILKKSGAIDLIFISADQPLLLPYWADELVSEGQFSFITCSYQSYTGFVGPLITPLGKRYSEIIKKDKQVLQANSDFVKEVNNRFRHPTCSPVNGILANMAVLESLKHILDLGHVKTYDSRAILNLKTFEIIYNGL